MQSRIRHDEEQKQINGRIMCGRFALTAEQQKVEAFFGVVIEENFPPRFNIAPTQPVLAVHLPEAIRNDKSNLPPFDARLVRWGFIPAWTKALETWPLTFNIRSETVDVKRSFRNALHYRRVLIPATGFYEWKKRADGTTQPFFIRPRKQELIGFAALMETWSGADGSEIDTAGIITTAANAVLKPLHHRMPVVLEQAFFARWLDVRNYRPADVLCLLKAVPDDFFEMIPVSDKINNARHQGDDVQEQVAEKTADNNKIQKQGRQLDLF